MRILFLLILTVVFFIGSLISPDKFSDPNVIFNIVNTATPTAAEIEPTAIAESQLPALNNPAPDTVDIVTALTETDTPVPTAVTENSNPSEIALDQIFGDPKVVDVFERGSSGFGINAGLNDDENIRIIALNNRLSLEPKKNNGFLTWRLRPPTVADSAVQMEFAIITCARGDRTGILMRSEDYTGGHGYYFSLSCEGTFSIMKDSTVINTADARGAFRNDSGDINVMSAVAQGNTLTAYLNGQKLLSVQDETYKEGFNGFFTAPQGQNTLTMDITKFTEYYQDSNNTN